ncbi:MAG: carbon starvation CstA family protein [Chloroflexota bacterium]|nr:carbon starvation CstA family protein [Chloroflexota bacterium]
MNTLIAVVLGAATFFVGYKYYAQRIDRDIIKADPKKATPAKMYMDGVDFSPASRNVLYGFQFKSIAASGPIVGTITAAALWGWLPALIWLLLGVTFIGWVQDYSAMMMSARRDGDSLSATAHKLMSPTSRTILLIFIFIYLLIIAGAFGNLLSGIFASTPSVPLGIVVLALAGVLAGQMLYKWKMDLVVVTLVTVGITLIAILAGPLDAISGVVNGLNGALNSLTGNQPFYQIFDPTLGGYAGGFIKYTPSYVFWLLFLIVFCYLGAVLPIWRYAQPVNYIGFWIMALTLVGGFVGAVVAVVANPALATFTLPMFKGWDAGVKGALQPLWPMLFVTVACGAISGWHSLISTVGTARQLENETDALPVGGGAMFSENLLAILALMAISVGTAGGGAAAFAAGVGGFLSVFGLDVKYGTALAFAAFVIIVITVLQLVIRFMRVSLTEWLGDSIPAMRNMHVGTIISAALMFFVVLSGTFTYLYQLFGGANQLMASLALMLVGLWLTAEGKKALWVWLPMLFMYVTTIVANLITAWNMYANIIQPNLGKPGYEVPILGAALLIFAALFLVGAALFLGWEGWKAYGRLRGKAPKVAAAKA